MNDRNQEVTNSKSEPRSCVSCGNEFAGNYCNICGEKVLLHSERTFTFLLRRTWKDITLIDNKLFKTLKLLLTRPGTLSLEIVRGKRVGLVSPISLFFLGNLIYFLFPLFNTFNTQLQTQMTGLVYSEAFNIEERVKEKIKSNEVPFGEFQKNFNELSYTNSKLMLVIVVPMYSLFLLLLNSRKKEYYLDHLTYAYEFVSLILFAAVILLGLLVKIFHWISLSLLHTDLYLNEFIISTVVSLIVLMYSVFGVSKFYHHGILKSIVIGLALAFSFALIVFLYRLILFEVTFFFI